MAVVCHILRRMTSFLYRLGRGAVRRRRLVALLCAVVAVGVIIVGQASGGTTSDAFDIPGVESQSALDVLERDFPSAAAVDAALADVAAQPDVGTVGELQRAGDDTIAYADVQYDKPSEEIRDEGFQRLEATAAAANDSGAVQMELGGDLPSEAAQEEPAGQEVIGLAVAVVVLP